MDIWKIIYYTLWVHVWFSIIYSMHVLWYVFVRKTKDTDDDYLKQSRKHTNEIFDRISGMIGKAAACATIFIGIFLTSVIAFSYLRVGKRRPE